MTKLFLIAASSLLAVASGGPVAAREPAATVAATAPAEQPAPKRAASPDQLYCVVDTITGSRIPQKTCQTRSDWLRQGFDPLNPDK